MRGYVVDEHGWRVPALEGVRATVWKARTKVRDSDGVIRHVERLGSTKAKAENALKAALVGRQTPTKTQGGLRPTTSMLDAGRLWIEQLEYADVSPKTRKQYAEEFERYVVGSAIQGLTLREANNVGVIERFLHIRAAGRARAELGRCSDRAWRVVSG